MTADVDVPLVVGDLVGWTSKSRGVQRHRVGLVAAVVPADAKPGDHVPPGDWRLMFRTDVARRRTSYLVAIKGEGRGRGLLHHPHTGGLHRFRLIGALRSVDLRATIKRTGDLLASQGVLGDVPAHMALVPYSPPARRLWPWRLGRIVLLLLATAAAAWAHVVGLRLYP